MKTMLTFVALLGLLMFPSAFVRAEVYASRIHLTNLSEPPASITVIAGSPQSAQVSTAFPIRFRVLVRDSLGNPVPGVTVTWTPPLSGPSGTFERGVNTAVTDSSGIATSATFTANLIAGSYVVPATAPGVVTPAFFFLRNLPGPPASITPTAGTRQSTRVNTVFPTRFRLVVRDAAGNPVAGVVVSWSAPLTGPSGRFEGGVGGTTDTSGIIEAPPFRANSIAGSYVVLATTPGVIAPAMFFLTNRPGSPASVTAIAGTPQSALVGTAFATNFRVFVRDSFNNPVPGVTVTWTPPVRGPSGTFEGGVNTAVTDTSGRATSATFTANDTAGSYAVPATVVGVSTPAIFFLTNLPGPTAGITPIAGTPQSTRVNTPFPIRFQVLVRDSFGNPVFGATVTWTPPARGASGTFLGGVNTAVTNTSGVATSATFTANDTAGTYTVPATVQGIGATAFFLLTNTADPLSVENQTPNLIPDRFALQQNYPNPFNPTTEIRYQTSEVSRVALNVFDMLGRKVATLVDEVQEAGFKTVKFDAGGLASGVYFYQLKAGGFLSTKRMLIIR